MSRRTLAVKVIAFALLWGALALLTWRTTTLEPNLIKALKDGDPAEEQLFAAYQANNPFAQKLFIHSSLPLGEPLPEKVAVELAKAGYSADQLSPALDKPLWWYLALLPKGKLDQLMSPPALADTANTAAQQIAKPGGSMALAAMAGDPFGIKRAALTRLHSGIFADASPAPTGQVLSFSRSADASAEDLLPLYDELKAHPGLTALAGELFTLENTLAVKKDMHWGFTLATIANIALFLWLCPSLILLLFLIVGTSLSYLVGLLLLNISFPYVFTITLAFTSTFASFNNEYLVHLSGMDGDRWQRMSRGLISAIGTTLIIFVLLALSSSVLIQQVALISIGGMVGFIGLLLAFTELLAKVRYRDISLPSVTISRSAQRGLCVIAWLAAAALLSQLTTQTDIGNFRYESEYLSKSRQHFEQLRAASFARTPVAYEVADTSWQQQLPAILVASKQETSARMARFAAAEAAARTELALKLKAKGLRLPLDKAPPLAPLPADYQLAALRLIDDVTPLPYLLTTSGRESGQKIYVVAYQLSATADAKGKSLSPKSLSPKSHYDRILTAASKDMMRLFGLGFAVIVGFLWFMQRPRDNVAYILTPLALALIALTLLLGYEGRAINFIHLLGFSLVLAVALDYSTIAVSSGFHRTERSKILFTGLSTTVTFGILSLASHPVLIDLGTTVALGSFAALCYALFIRVPPT